MKAVTWLSMIFLLSACTSTRPPATAVESTPGVPLQVMEILRAEDTRNPNALLQMVASLNFDRTSTASRLAIASGRIPCFKTWSLLAQQFGQDKDVARALAVAARFPETKFPANEVLKTLLALPYSSETVKTMMTLDTDAAFQAALGLKAHQPTVAANLWRMKSRVDRHMLAAFYKRFPRETVISIARMKITGIVTAEDLSRMPWMQRQAGCPVCDSPERFLSDSSWQVRVAALQSAGSVAAVRPLLQDPSDLVRLEAHKAMLRLDPEWLPENIQELTPGEAEILAASNRASPETIRKLFNRGGMYAEVTAPVMPASEARSVMESNVTHRARIRFLDKRFGQAKAVEEARRVFDTEGSAYALEYLLSRKSGVDVAALAEEARRKGGFTSVLVDFGYPSPAAIRPQADHYAKALKDLLVFKGFRIHTSKGVMDCRFFADQAPLTCSSFIHLARNGFFNGLLIHRVVPGFVTQDGDPSGSGSGGPGYALRCEYNELEYDRAGRVGMALAGKDTGGSQYFITHGPTPHLNQRYTIFAQVENGLDVLPRLCQYDRIERIELK